MLNVKRRKKRHFKTSKVFWKRGSVNEESSLRKCRPKNILSEEIIEHVN